jgi:putative ATPase
MKNLGYGKGYQYDPDTGFSGANYSPDGMPRETFYEPTSGGNERAITERLEHWPGCTPHSPPPQTTTPYTPTD